MEKEYNPALQFDAFTAGIEDGGLRSSSSIAILACYIIARSEEKLTKKNVVDALVEGKIANYFEITSAISKMIKTDNLVEGEDGYLSSNKLSKSHSKIHTKRRNTPSLQSSTYMGLLVARRKCDATYSTKLLSIFMLTCWQSSGSPYYTRKHIKICYYPGLHPTKGSGRKNLIYSFFRYSPYVSAL